MDSKRGDFMQRNTRIRHFLVVAGAASLMLATSVAAGAASTKGTYTQWTQSSSRLPTRAAPFRWRRTRPTRPMSPSTASGTMIGFDVDLIHAVATTLGVKVNENNVTFDDIIAGIKSGST
jgi:ABC-type amino acid transport substrate-binding protein